MASSTISYNGISFLGLGTIQCTSLIVTSGINNSAISPGAAIAADKVNHQYGAHSQLFSPTTTITALTQLLASIHGSTCALNAVQATIVTKATDPSRTVNIDLQRSTGGGAFATVLSNTIAFTNTTPNLVPVAGILAATTLLPSDLLQAVVTVAGAAGNQALGLLLSVWLQESVD